LGVSFVDLLSCLANLHLALILGPYLWKTKGKGAKSGTPKAGIDKPQ
jgi:hypothetical protein